MDRPRSPVKDAGRWVRSIPPLWCLLVDKHEERGRLPAVGRDDPARGSLFDCQWAATMSRPGSRRAALQAARPGTYRRFTGCSYRPVAAGNSRCSLLLCFTSSMLSPTYCPLLTWLPPVTKVAPAIGLPHFPTLREHPHSASYQHPPVPLHAERTTPTVWPYYGNAGMVGWR